MNDRGEHLLFMRLKDLSAQIWFRWLLGLALVLALAAVFTGLAEDVWFREGFAWDPPLILAIHQLSRPWLDAIMRAVAQTGLAGAILLTLALAAWFYWKRHWLNVATAFVSLSGASALNVVFKLVFARPRPALFPPLVAEHGFSFPSGHVTASVVAYGLLAIWLWRAHHRFWAVVAAGWVLVVALSRIYLGVHYPSDTLGSMTFASLWLFAVFVVHDWYEHRQQHR